MPDVVDDGIRYDETIRSTEARRLLTDAGLENEIPQYNEHAQAGNDNTNLTVYVEDDGRNAFTLTVTHQDGAYTVNEELPETYTLDTLDEQFNQEEW